MPKYFAYGSNMSDEQIAQRCPSHRFVCVAKLPGYRLAFTRRSAKRGCGVADVVATADEAVWGVVFEMSDADLAALDKHEGVHMNPPAYVRKNVQVVSTDGQLLDAITYEVFTKAANEDAPNAEYLGLITAGARKWGLPQEYQQALANIKEQT
ncbi:gamma-glutamylcyclotransferase family protein [Ramlibacter alkalitolerans]|uniref:Gamma-glutamylcyclotransferase n=1 Tax=Ramlibacter alkalitolerans TaxID=2039631 RepID=A0ABS1JMI5_9BURK|nr:gamma-glutamylcyclotransferase family protein [Ramlibacter alkalitolerans]MBL0425418.1 gamma-glutamylcyclotransferase [Ramlibacter alkalitolerans]